MPTMNKTKHPTKGKKKVQDGRTQVLANNETSKEGRPLRNRDKSSTCSCEKLISKERGRTRR
jgi:hypothetical protein